MRKYIVTLTVFTGDVSKGLDSSFRLPDFEFDTETEARKFCEVFAKSNRTLDRSKDTGRVFMGIEHRDEFRV